MLLLGVTIAASITIAIAMFITAICMSFFTVLIVEHGCLWFCLCNCHHCCHGHNCGGCHSAAFTTGCLLLCCFQSSSKTAIVVTTLLPKHLVSSCLLSVEKIWSTSDFYVNVKECWLIIQSIVSYVNFHYQSSLAFCTFFLQAGQDDLKMV